MGLFDRFKKTTTPVAEEKSLPEVTETPPMPKVTKPRKPRKPKEVAKEPAPSPKLKIKGKTPKDIANAKGEPYVAIISVDLDPDNIGNGAFELDWNDKFITNLARAGYEGKTDADMVDRWFQTVCRNIVMENYEQWEANFPDIANGRRVAREDLGDGKSSAS
jgi:hypothetical protein